MTQPTPSAVRGAPSAATDAYVINLCASTTPMALSRPAAPELARFTFFVSRRREEGRERFRLHMGYFATRDEAEQLLSLIRDLYPAAWVGEAPGKRLAQRAAAGTATTTPSTAAAPTAATPTTASAAAAAAQPAARPTAGAPATPSVVAPPAAKPAVRPQAAAAAPKAASPGAPTKASSTAAPSAPNTAPNTASNAASTKPAAAARARPAAPPPRVPPSNVREVIQSLDAAPPAPAAPASRAPAARAAAAAPPAAAPALSSAAPANPAAPAANPAAAARPSAPKRDELSDSQVLRILETRRANAVAQSAAATEARATTDIRMLGPDDTQTWRDIKSQLSRDAAVHFAVQLEWSVAPIDLDRVPPLAIFNAYTLYKIEGNRDGRKWYGLRLGFFSDAVAARQVAMYVRSEFATVAVVPVSGKERTDATQVGAIELSRPVAPVAAAADDAIELIDDAVDAALSRSEQPSLELDAEMAKAPLLAEQLEPAPRRQGRPRGSPQTLEETLEILGASQLSIDNGKGVRLDLGSGQRRSEPRNSTFSKLLDRLSEKLRG